MTTHATYWRTIFSPTNYEEDLRQNSPLIYLGTLSKTPTDHDFNLIPLREAVIKANFQANTHIAKLGAMHSEQKPVSARYEWKVIVATAAALFCIETITVIIFFLVITLPIFLKEGANGDHENATPFYKNLSFLMDLCAFIWLLNSCDALVKILLQAQKPYFDRHVAFQNVSYIPNSMAGFDVDQLANKKRKDGWDDPISLETISTEQISSSQILRIDQYAISIISALQSMLTTNYQPPNCPIGEIPHPVEIRCLGPDEKAKFLREVSAFFAISDTKKLEECWKTEVEAEDLAPFFSKIETWHILPQEAQFPIKMYLTEQIRPIKRKYAFLKLLPASVAQTYFDENFRSNEVKVPKISAEAAAEQLAHLRERQALLRDLLQARAEIFNSLDMQPHLAHLRAIQQQLIRLPPARAEFFISNPQPLPDLLMRSRQQIAELLNSGSDSDTDDDSSTSVSGQSNRTNDPVEDYHSVNDDSDDDSFTSTSEQSDNDDPPERPF